MVKNKTAVFYLDKANPDNFSLELKSKLKPGYHIHKIFKKGDIYSIFLMKSLYMKDQKI